jgi:hypothetical protein
MTNSSFNALKVALVVLGVASMALLATRSDVEVRIAHSRLSGSVVLTWERFFAVMA